MRTSKKHSASDVAKKLARVLVRTDASPGRAGRYKYGPASIWVSGPAGGTWWATVRFRSQEKDLDARSFDEVLDLAKKWIDDAPELRRY
jgi:hypothetical protein